MEGIFFLKIKDKKRNLQSDRRLKMDSGWGKQSLSPTSKSESELRCAKNVGNMVSMLELQSLYQNKGQQSPLLTFHTVDLTRRDGSFLLS